MMPWDRKSLVLCIIISFYSWYKDKELIMIYNMAYETGTLKANKNKKTNTQEIESCV